MLEFLLGCEVRAANPTRLVCSLVKRYIGTSNVHREVHIENLRLRSRRVRYSQTSALLHTPLLNYQPFAPSSPHLLSVSTLHRRPTQSLDSTFPAPAPSPAPARR